MEVIGHQKQWCYLKKSAQSGRLSHAYLFSGLEKLGKRTLALQWVCSLLGQDIKNLNSHPDFIFIKAGQLDSSNSLKGKEEIQIAQIRNLIWRFSFNPLAAPLKAAVIDNAHLMNQQAQACLLKTLEEPKGKALLILISDKKQYLLETIISRLQVIKFNPVKKEEIKSCLSARGILKEEAEKISNISLGRPGLALDLISSKEKLETFRQKINELNKISRSPLYFRFQYVKDLAENTEIVRETLDIWLNYLRAVLLAKEKFAESSSFAKYPTLKIKNIINQIEIIKLLLSSTNVNPKLTLETLMLAI